MNMFTPSLKRENVESDVQHYYLLHIFQSQVILFTSFMHIFCHCIQFTVTADISQCMNLVGF